MLSERELKEFRHSLEEMKVQIENNLSSISSEFNTMKSNELKDEADYALVEKGQNINNTLALRQIETLKAIKRSLKRLDNGTYGICESCGEAIRPQRLQVKIFADYCISCREKIEEENK